MGEEALGLKTGVDWKSTFSVNARICEDRRLVEKPIN